MMGITLQPSRWHRPEDPRRLSWPAWEMHNPGMQSAPETILSLSPHLQRDAFGIWTDAAARDLAYRKDGHDRYFKLEDESFWFKHRNACIVAALKRFPPPG